MATLSEKKTKQLEYGVWVLKRTDSSKQYRYVKKHNANGLSFGALGSAMRFSTQRSAKNYIDSWLLKGVKPVRVWGTKKAWDNTISW